MFEKGDPCHSIRYIKKQTDMKRKKEERGKLIIHVGRSTLRISAQFVRANVLAVILTQPRLFSSHDEFLLLSRSSLG